ALGSVSQPLHCRIQPGWQPPDALPERGTASPNLPSGYCGNSVSGPCARRCWSRSFTRHRFSTLSCIAASTFWPRPVRSRWYSAATIPSARCSPVPLSPICAPVTSGGPSSKPVVEAEPPAHCATFSYTLQSWYGPGPNPFTEARIMRGFNCWIRSQLNPIRSSAPGAKFSTSTSQCLTSRSSSSLPCGFLPSIVIERLLWFSIVKYSESTPAMSRSCPRVGSPSPGRSTLSTSAPNHASSCVHVGPDCTCVKSSTRTPSNALTITKRSCRDL